MKFGKRVRQLRLERRMTKEELCQDESELSVRQLTRIESGVSTPTLSKVIFITQRLKVSISDLADEENFKLPQRYEELKFLLLRTQTYLEKERIAKRAEYLEEIFDNYYDNLPEEEQLIVEILQSSLDLASENGDFSVKKILDDYLQQIKHKRYYTLNDLILVDLYSMYISYKEYLPTIYDEQSYQHIIETLLITDQHLKIDELFFLNKAISSAASNCVILKNKHCLQRLLAKMEEIMFQTQDFHRTHVLNLLKWKYHLLDGNSDLARVHYLNATTFTNITLGAQLTARLTEEWENDLNHLA